MSENTFFDSDRTVSEEIKIKNLNVNKKMNESAGRYVNESCLEVISDKKFDIDHEKKKVKENLDKLKNLEVEEFTFKKKWEEIKSLPFTIRQFEDGAKEQIWMPTDLNNEETTVQQIKNLQPRMMLVTEERDEKLWKTLRYYCHSAEFEQTPGRFLKFLLIDDVSGKILGLTAVGSDVIAISDRDKYIGWTTENKLEQKMLKYSAIGSTIFSTQPFGSNFLGGKLVACMITSQVVRDAWEKQDYGEAKSCKLVGMTTTSLYGRPSMYDALKWWDSVGLSKGKIPLKPDEDVYELWHGWLKQYKEKDYNEAMTQKEGVSGPVTGAKMRVLSMIFKECGIQQSKYTHGYERGIYYSCFYENTKEFLCGKISEDKLIMKPLFQKDAQAIIDWWKPMAIKRYIKLKLDGRLNPNKLFYNSIHNETYEESKKKFLSNINKGKDNAGK